MSSLFIQVEQSLLTHGKTLRLARLLSLDRCAVIGRWWRGGRGVSTMRQAVRARVAFLQRENDTLTAQQAQQAQQAAQASIQPTGQQAEEGDELTRAAAHDFGTTCAQTFVAALASAAPAATSATLDGPSAPTA